MPELTKCTRLKYSSRSFWMGVPEIRTRRGVFKLLRAWYVWFSEFFSLWPFEKKKKRNEADKVSGPDRKQLGDPHQHWYTVSPTRHLTTFPIPGSGLSIVHVFSCCDRLLSKARIWWETWSHYMRKHDITSFPDQEHPSHIQARGSTMKITTKMGFPVQRWGCFQLPTLGTEL